MYNNYSEALVGNEISVLILPPTMLKQYIQKKITQVKREKENLRQDVNSAKVKI